MKKILIPLLFSLLLISCATKNSTQQNQTKTNSASNVKIEAGKAVFTNIDYEEKVVQYNKYVDGFDYVTVVNCGKSSSRNIVTVDLKDFADMELYFDFSCSMKIVDSTGGTNDVIWMVNEFDAGFPELSRKVIPSDEWTTFSGTRTIALSGPRQFYISAAGITKENITVYIKDFKLVLYGDNIGKEKVVLKSWTEEPSLAEAYAPYFDYFGFATPLQNVLTNGDVLTGLPMQASCITMENEMKPDFLFAWQKPANFQDFVAEDGNVYVVPGNLPSFKNVNAVLQIAKSLGIKMRGHVLVWHNQTPDWFFRVNYGSSKDAYVDEATMNARMEWYIKSVLEYIKNWEDKNNNGERIIITWDVVNEAASDNATKTQWLRTDSNWFRIYQSDRFIVNAFRYANKYAPKDVKLAYNDYGCASSNKSDAIVKIVNAIQAAPDARIDVVGMQTHVGMNTIVSGPGSFETSVKKFLATGLDVQITEMDIGQDGQRYNSEKLAQKYAEFFNMFLANRKTADKNGICGVTLWGIIDERSWIYNNNGTKQHPLLFEGDYTCKPAFYAVLDAAKNPN